jgi:hypothetical protein
LRHRRLSLALSILALFAVAPSFALRPGIPRVTGFTDHFSLTIDAAKSEILPQLAALAESCWTKEARVFEFRPPGRIQMVFLDEQDYANGSAYAPQEWVVIYLRPAEFALRGRTRWLPNVMSHEIGHVFTLRKMGQDSRFLGWGLFHTWFGRGPSRFEERFQWEWGRIPPWLAEGLAQYAAAMCGFDTLDNRRRMELRVAAASGQLLTPAELKGFAWDSRRNEMIYAQGYSLVSWLASTYGPGALNRYMEAANRSGWRGAFDKAFGKGLADLYGEWRRGLEAQSHYDPDGDGVYVLPAPAGPYAVESFPSPLGDGRFLYLSSRDNDGGETDLFLGDARGHAGRLFRNATSISMDLPGGRAYFTATRYAFGKGERFSELYGYDLKSGAIREMTAGARLIRGCASGGGIYGLRDNEGRTSIVRIENGGWTTVFAAPDSFEITDLAPGRTGGSLTLGTASGFGNDLRELDLASLELSPLADSPQDEVDPHWSGDTLYFSADYAGDFDVYAMAGGTVTRLTHVDGGAFHPFPARDGLWLSAYGPTGFRLARARALDKPPPFFVELPTRGWSAPKPAEYEADSYDHSRLSFLGYDLSLGLERRPGFLDTVAYRDGSRHALSASTASRGLAMVGLYWMNPNGVMDLEGHIGLSQPLGYEGATHLDRTNLDMRIRAFLPEIVAGGSFLAYDFPDFTVDTLRTSAWQSELDAYLGARLRLAEYWMISGLGLMEQDFAEDGITGSHSSDRFLGFKGRLDFQDLQSGMDGIVKGITAFVQGGMPPRVNAKVPEWSADAGATLYASLARILYLDGSLYHTEEIADSAKRWLYGGAHAYMPIPLGMQIGTRGGAGLYLEKVYPTLEYREMARFPGRTQGTPGSMSPAGQGAEGQGRAAQGIAPRLAGFGSMIDWQTSREVGFGLALRTLAFSGRPAFWSAFLRFDAKDFGREPAWAVEISL